MSYVQDSGTVVDEVYGSTWENIITGISGLLSGGDGSGAWSNRTLQGRAANRAASANRSNRFTTATPPYFPGYSNRPLDSTRAGIGGLSSIGGIYGKVAAGVLTVGGYALDWWRKKAKEEERLRKLAEAARIKAAKDAAAKAAREAAQMRKDEALARSIATTAQRNAQTIQRMQIAGQRVAISAQNQSASQAEKAREFDLNRQDRLAKDAAARQAAIDKARRHDAERQRADDRARDAAQAAQTKAAIAARNARIQAKTNAQLSLIKLLYQGIILPAFRKKPKEPRQAAAQGFQQSWVGAQAPLIFVNRAKRKKRKKKKRLTRVRRRKVA